MFNLRGASDFRNVVEIAVRIGFFQIDGRRNLVVLHGDERSRDTRGATGALRVSNLGFERRHWNFISTVAQRQLKRARFNTVIQVGRRSVQVYVLDVLRGDASLFHGQTDSAGGL